MSHSIVVPSDRFRPFAPRVRSGAASGAASGTGRSRRPGARRALARLGVGVVAGALGATLPGAWQATRADEAPRPDLVGQWSRLQDWPIIAIHAVVNPDGTLLTFGADGDSVNATGTGPKRHDTYDPRIGLHATVEQDAQDYFCSATVVMPDSGRVLIAGGDDLLKGSRGNALSSFYDFRSGDVVAGPDLRAPRWYATATTLPDERVLLQGGRFEDDDDAAFTPEILDGGTWTDLAGATSDRAYGRIGEERRWWYPRAFVDPFGKVFTISHSTMFTLDPAGDGALEFHGDLPDGHRAGATSSAVMYAPGKILVVGGGGMNNTVGGPALASAAIVDITTGTPIVTPVSPMHFPRHWANATVLPDGQVLVTGGSGVNNELRDVALQAEIWNPATRAWTVMAAEERARLYHASAVLMPDGRVFSGGGGAPGPVANLDAQFFSPPYLFDAAGQRRARPAIAFAPRALAYGGRFDLRAARGSDVARVTLVKTGAATHSFNMDQRFVELGFEVDGDAVTVTAPAGPNAATPGHYLLSIIDADGVVSESRIVSLLNGTAPDDVERAPVEPTAAQRPGTPTAGVDPVAVDPADVVDAETADPSVRGPDGEASTAPGRGDAGVGTGEGGDGAGDGGAAGGGTDIDAGGGTDVGSVRAGGCSVAGGERSDALLALLLGLGVLGTRRRPARA